MAPRKTPTKKVTPGLQAAQKYLGLVKNAQGQWVKPGAALATKTLQTIATNAGYQAGGTAGTRTPLGSPSGNRLGFVDNATGLFSLAGRAPGAGSGKGLGAKGKGGQRRKRGGNAAAGKGLDEPLAQSPYAENDLSTTSYLRTQGKAYAAGRAGNAGSLAGATAAPAAKKKPAKRKGMLKKKGRGGSVMKPTIKISKSGKVTPNKGGRKARGK